jgi:hypothetical protein
MADAPAAGKLHAARALPLLFLAAALAFMARHDARPLEYIIMPDGPLAHTTNFGSVWLGLALGLPLYAAYAYFAYGATEGRPEEREGWLVFGFYAFVLGAVMLVWGVNTELDRGAAVEHTVAVTGKYESRSLQHKAAPAKAWRLTLESWRPGENVKVVSVSEADHARAAPGKSRYRVRVRPGFLGFPWLESRELLP